MSLVVEDGSGKPDAQCYRNAADTAAYHTARGNATFAALNEAAQEAAILKAQEFMRDNYGAAFAGYRVKVEQALDWPRYDVQKQGFKGDVYWQPTEIPTLLADVESDLALKTLSGPLVKDLGQAKTSVKVGPIAVEYDKNASRQTFYAAIEAKVSQFFGGYSGNGVAQIVRT